MNYILGKILYGTLFMMVLPIGLFEWAISTQNIIQLPVPDLPAVSILLLILGIVFCLWGMVSLIVLGKGLPMNAFPPKYYVSKGIYSLINHPIYTGAGIITIALSMFFKSSSGFWLISTLFCLAMVTFVIGFENENIKRKPGYFKNKAFFSLPDNSNEIPTPGDRIKVYVLAIIPWTIIYELLIYIGVPKDVLFTNLNFEKYLPVIQFSEIFYVLPYFLIIIIPAIFNSKSQIRDFIQDVWWAMIIGFFIYMVFPFVVHQRNFVPSNFFGHFIIWERSYDSSSGALPAFHVIWAFLLSKHFSIRFGFKKIWLVLAIIISLSCIGNGSHSFLDVISGYIVYCIINYRNIIWNTTRQIAEKIADSWKEWHFGKVRLINHSLFGGIAGFAGMLIVGFCLGKEYAFIGFFIGIIGIIGAALWAQFIEGSPKLLRPYGYYGCILGIVSSGIIISIFYNCNFFYIMASYSLAGPWIQIIGRFRCLIQGCCHGKPCNEYIGIRFVNSKSRVLKIADLKGIHIHPTQLYSIILNFIIGLFLIRLIRLNLPVSFITGIYLILNGLARFVEESFRGEPQTPYWKGMRLYQWIAVISIVVGAAITTIPIKTHITMTFNSTSFFFALIMGILATIAYGVDFPKSNKRFARLTS